MSRTESRAALTPEQIDVLEFLAPNYEDGLSLAYDIAVACGITPRAMGQKLRALERRGLVWSAYSRDDRLYGWDITEAGIKAVA